MLQSSGALSAYPKSICLSSGIILPGTCKGDFHNRFYIIQLKFEINHCTWRAWVQSAGCRVQITITPKRQSAISAHQHAKSRFPSDISVPQSAPPCHRTLCNGTHHAFPPEPRAKPTPRQVPIINTKNAHTAKSNMSITIFLG